MKAEKRVSRFVLHSVTLLRVGVSLAVGVSLPASAQTLTELRAAHKAAYDPKALLLLKQMADAYSRLTELDQTTSFYVLQTPMIQGKGKREKGKENTENKDGGSVQAPDEQGTLPRTPVEKPMGRSVRLLLSAPNRLRLETTEGASESEPAKTFVSVCDGKILWTFNPDKNWYTQEKAPRRLHDFQKVPLSNTTLETMMAVGMNPFADVETHFDAAKYDGAQDVGGVPVEVVLLRAVSEQQTQDLRFYIGRDDSLLRRIVIESTPVVHELVMPKRDPLDDLIAHPARSVAETPTPATPVAPGFEDPHPLRPPGAPIKVRLTLENTLNFAPRFTASAFRFEPPAGAMLYNDVNGSHDFSKMTNAGGIEELLRKARAMKHSKKSKPKVFNPADALQP